MENDGACLSGFGIRNIDPPGQPVTFGVGSAEGKDEESLGHPCSCFSRTDYSDALQAFELRGSDLQVVPPDAHVPPN